MKRMFAAVTSFFRRLRVTWIASRDPNLLDAIEHYKALEKQKQKDIEFSHSVKNGMRGVVRSLIPPLFGRTEEKGSLKVNFKSRERMTFAEADEVVAQSRVPFILPRDAAAFKRLAEHEDKLEKRQIRRMP